MKKKVIMHTAFKLSTSAAGIEQPRRTIEH